MALAALALAAASGGAWLLLTASQIIGVPLPGIFADDRLWSVTIGTRFGDVMLLRLGAALLLAALLLVRKFPWLQLTAACGLVAPLAFVGHAGAVVGKIANFVTAADIAHLFAATLWLGALPAFARLLNVVRRAGNPEWDALAVHVTRRFSAFGVVCVGVLLASGVFNGWILAGGITGLVTTAYGGMLVIKLVLFAAMVGVATVNHFVITPRLPAATALRQLTRNSLLETGLGLGVLAAVAVLGTLEPGAHAPHLQAATIPPDAAFVHIHTPEVMADVMIEPGRTGPVRATIRVMREDLSEFPAPDVSLALDPPGATRPGIPEKARYGEDGTWVVDRLNLTQSGVWTARVLVAIPDREPAMLDGPIVIER